MHHADTGVVSAELTSAMNCRMGNTRELARILMGGGIHVAIVHKNMDLREVNNIYDSRGSESDCRSCSSW